MSERYAIFFAPAAGSDLARFGDRWLGRDVESGESVDHPTLSGFDAARLHEITEAPRHYGFHGTLKPPFRLADGCDSGDLRRALVAVAAQQRGFEIEALTLEEIGGFIALVPDQLSPALSDLADLCVTEFDCYRAPPDAGELARRHAAGLTPRQAELLARWGYPYLMDEFRFHLTLTGSIADAAERARVARFLGPLVAPLLSRPLPMRELCLFQQPDRATPFQLIQRFPFGR